MDGAEPKVYTVDSKCELAPTCQSLALSPAATGMAARGDSTEKRIGLGATTMPFNADDAPATPVSAAATASPATDAAAARRLPAVPGRCRAQRAPEWPEEWPVEWPEDCRAEGAGEWAPG